MNVSIQNNRDIYLSELRSGKYKKGTIRSDEKGYPIIENEADNDGACACAIMGMIFGKTESGKISLSKAAKALGLTNKDCKIIQAEINDRNSTFIEDADIIENRIFNK